MAPTARPRYEDPHLYAEDILELAEKVQRAATVRKSIAKAEVENAVDRITQNAEIRGLLPDVLEILVDTVTTMPCYIDQPSATRIIKGLIPRKKVQDTIAIKIIGCLGNGPRKPSSAIQVALLRWLVMVYDVLENPGTLSRMYSILFNLLDMMSLRSHLCHLLSLITKRSSVKPFRIQALLELKRSIGEEHCLNALIHIYKTYYPDVIIDDPGIFRKGIFSHPDPEWIQNVFTIQQSHAALDLQQPGKSAFKVDTTTEGQASKRRRIELAVIPRVSTYQAVESSVTLEEVQSAQDLVAKLYKLELPNQLAAALDSPVLQRLLLLRPSDTSVDRIDNWLSAKLGDAMRVSSSSSSGTITRFGILLSKILDYTRMSRTLLPSLEEFLRKYIHVWDGKLHRDLILELLSFVPLTSYDDLSSNYLAPVEHLLLKSDETAAVALLRFYTAFLRNWAIQYAEKSPDTEDLTEETNIIRKFVKHVGQVCLQLQHTLKESAIMIDGILSFYESASSLPWDNSLFYIELPPDPLVYWFVFVGDAMALSRICGILSSYKTGFDIAIQRKSNDINVIETGGYPQSHVTHFNGFLMDICNCLWRSRAFMRQGAEPSSQDPAALGCNIPEPVTEQLSQAAQSRGEQLRSLFSFSHSPIFGNLAAECFRSLEEAQGVKKRHSGPVTQPSLKALGTMGGVKMSHLEYRIAVLKDLQEKGLMGMGEFMYNTMISLRTARASLGGATGKGK
ncbi:Mis6-domain-containing protein [Ascodesmis nigricans]|uniref:Mis6-domain-containing protein n=1 Tax=Ascodesmis nigricans TaxID=341454 RepID=A0A4S2N4A5_9PEZI|nr:Mis6-domain-containing protein [Ascodesmis nigricans]